MRKRTNPLERYFLNNRGRQIDKWMHYFDIYDRHFSQYRGTKPTVVEFGVQHGGSLQMWQWYFGRGARIIGVDIDPRCESVGDPGVEILIGDQDDREFLKAVARHAGEVDVLIEDGGHRMSQQVATFEEIWPVVSNGGVYLTEDLHTNYWDRFGGGFRRPTTFIEYAKALVDQQNAWHSEVPELAVTPLTDTVAGIHTYDSVIVFDKALKSPHDRRTTGTPSF
jgi:cephalosporin hydroxylase